MANRCSLHMSHVEEFKKWLIKDGWKIEEPKGFYEVLRARKDGKQRPLIVYKKLDAKEHLSVDDRDIGIVGAFLRDMKKTKTNADRIRSMSDEELAEWLSSYIPCRTCPIEDDCEDDIPCNWVILEWLKKEVEDG